MPTQLDPQTGLLVKDQPITPVLDAQGNFRDSQGTLQHDPNWVDPSKTTITPPANTGQDNTGTSKPKTSMNIGGVDVDTTDWTDEQRGLANQQIADNDQQIADYTANKATYEAELATIDSEAVPLIQNIKIKYDKLIADMNTKNKGVLGNVQTAQFRTGRARYASELAEGQIGAELNAGSSRISELNGQMAQEISLAKATLTSRAENRFSMLNDHLKNVAAIRKEKLQTLTDTLKRINDEEKWALEKSKIQRGEMEATADNIASSLFSILGDDVEANTKKIIEAAKEYGIDPNILIGRVREYAKEDEEFKTKTAKDYLDMAKDIKFGEEYAIPGTDIVITGTKDKEYLDITKTIGSNEYKIRYDMTDPENPKEMFKIDMGAKYKPDGGDDEKEITKFRADAAELIGKLDEPESQVSWGTAFDQLRTKYPQATDDTINAILGGGIPYSPETGFDTKKAWGRAKKK